MTSKTHCMTCRQAIGQFKCEGCSQTFCIKHVLEHRQLLHQQLAQVTLEHDALIQATCENKSQHHSLIANINQWEQTSIDKIRQMAADARQEVAQMENVQNKLAVSQELQHLSQRINKAREDDDFFETDIRDWIVVLDKLKQQLKTSSSSINIEEDQTKPLIYHIRMSSSLPNVKSLNVEMKNRHSSHQSSSNLITCDDRFEHCYGNAIIEDHGRIVTNGNDSFFGTEIRGKVEYSSGKHYLHFRIDNNPSKIWIFIGIVSRVTPMGENLFTSSSVYGWGDYNDYFLAGQRQKTSGDVIFIHTVEKDIIELIIDCPKQLIHYNNERHRKSEQLSIDLNKCPFPWQLYISLGGRGDQIRLLNTPTVF